MHATPTSRVRSKHSEGIKIINRLLSAPCEPRRVRSKWPATMFAASRIDKVPGRIIFLTVSIRTINGIRAPGVPDGTR